MSRNELKRLGGDILGDQTARKSDDNSRAETSRRGPQRGEEGRVPERPRKKPKSAVRSDDDEVRSDSLLCFVSFFALFHCRSPRGLQ